MQPQNPNSPNVPAPSSLPSTPPATSSAADPAPVPDTEIIIQRGGVGVTEAGLSHDINVLKDAIEIWAGLLANKGIKVMYRGTDCYATQTTIVLPELTLLDVKNPSPERLKEVAAYLEAVRGQVAHEVSHHIFSTFDDVEVLAFKNISPIHSNVQNVVEDVYCERKMEDNWPGTGLDLKNLNEWLYREHVRPENWPKLGTLTRVLFGWMVLAQYGAKHWFYRGLSDNIRGVIEMLLPEAEAVKKINTSKETLVIAASILEKLKVADKAPPKPQQPPQQPQQAAGQSAQAGGEKAGKQTKKEKEKKGKRGKGAKEGSPKKSGKKGGSEAAPPKGAGPGAEFNPLGEKIKQEMAAGDPGGMRTKAEMLGGFIKDDIRKPVDRQGRYLIYTTEHDTIGPVDKVLPATMRQPKLTVDEAVAVEKLRYRKIVEESEGAIGVFRRRMRSLLTEQSRPVHHYEQEEGALDMEHLYRVALPNTGNRIFVQTSEQSDTKDVAVALVINESGSMGGVPRWRCDTGGTVTDPVCVKAKLHHDELRKTNPTMAPFTCLSHAAEVNNLVLAIRTAILFGEVLEDIGTQFRIVGHCAKSFPRHVPISAEAEQLYTRIGALKLIEYKGWNERFEVVRHKLMRATAGGGTYDGEALVRVAHDISKRKEKRKIIFMLDDGIPEPVGGHQQEHQDYFYRSIRQVMAAGIEVVGLGMGVEGVTKYYPHNVVIRKVDDTPQIATKELRRILTQPPKETRFV